MIDSTKKNVSYRVSLIKSHWCLSDADYRKDIWCAHAKNCLVNDRCWFCLDQGWANSLAQHFEVSFLSSNYHGLILNWQNQAWFTWNFCKKLLVFQSDVCLFSRYQKDRNCGALFQSYWFCQPCFYSLSI